MTRNKRLIAPNGQMLYTHIGLVDKDGVFMLLLDSNETARFRFADCNDALSVISQENDELKNELDVVRHDLKCRDATVKRLKTRIDKYKEQIESDKKQAKEYMNKIRNLQKQVRSSRNDNEESGAA